jgi:hypothetical protein
VIDCQTRSVQVAPQVIVYIISFVNLGVLSVGRDQPHANPAWKR